jgi:hypothetical protein
MKTLQYSHRRSEVIYNVILNIHKLLYIYLVHVTLQTISVHVDWHWILFWCLAGIVYISDNRTLFGDNSLAKNSPPAELENHENYKYFHSKNGVQFRITKSSLAKAIPLKFIYPPSQSQRLQFLSKGTTYIIIQFFNNHTTLCKKVIILKYTLNIFSF